MQLEQRSEWMERVKDFWCEFFHDNPRWPIKGRYQCGSCLRYHAVRWEQSTAQQGTTRAHNYQVEQEAAEPV